MNFFRIVIPSTLVVLLAACGGGTTTPPPADTTVPTPTTPTTPTDPGTPETPPPAPVNPGEGVMYYGEWGWQYQETGDFALNNEGRFSISEVHTEPGFTGSFGFYQTCYYGTCYDSVEGGVIFGTLEEEGFIMILYRLDTSNNAVPVYLAKDSDGAISQDAQGRDVFEGTATWADTVGDARSGNFVATKIADDPVIVYEGASTGSRLERQIQKHFPGFKAFRY